jgi:alpha-L-rhamnosidase
VIEQNWAAMQKYLNAIDAANPDGLWKNEAGIPFGDWLSPEGKTDYTLIATAYWAYDVDADASRWRTPQAARRTNETYAALFDQNPRRIPKAVCARRRFVAGADNSLRPSARSTIPTQRVAAETRRPATCSRCT